MSDPAKPVPFPRAAHSAGGVLRRRPPRGRSGLSTISVKRRAAPMSCRSCPTCSTAPVKISGEPVASIFASTSGTDSDWVVKVIDVCPDEVAGQPHLGGYQLMVSADIFRGHYRGSLELAVLGRSSVRAASDNGRNVNSARQASFNVSYRRRPRSRRHRATGARSRSRPATSRRRSRAILPRCASPSTASPSSGTSRPSGAPATHVTLQ